MKTPMTSLPLCLRPQDGSDTRSSLSESWNNKAISLTYSGPFDDHSSLLHRPALDPRSPVSAMLSPEISPKEEPIASPDMSPRFMNITEGSLKRKPEDDDDDGDIKSVSLPGFQTLLPYPEFHGRPHTINSLRTPSATPEPREGDVYPVQSGLLPGQDPIIEKLNHLRIENNKQPLKPLGSLCTPDYLNQASHKWMALQDMHSEVCQQPTPPREIRKRRAKTPKTTHCNIKYLVEELDYIRYHRVDLLQKWMLVENNYRVMFPLARETQGLQGRNYRQNYILPRIHNNMLVFMENGHVESVCVKTKEQTERKHLYTLVYLYPERAMRYPWVTPSHRERARELNEKRQKQIKRARLEAKARGTYIEKLPSDISCGCCPGEDRERDKKKKAFPKSNR